MMKQRNKFNFIFLENVQAKIVEIPYKGKELSMFVLLPVEIDGLKKVRIVSHFLLLHYFLVSFQIQVRH
jgi:serine protease inhibitor